MSEIPYTKRKKTKLEFFDHAISLRIKILQYIDHDFIPYNSDGSKKSKYEDIIHTKNNIRRLLERFIYNLTQANSIYFQNLHEANIRRDYMTSAIGDLEAIIHELQFSMKYLEIDPDKYVYLIDDIEKEETSIRNWRKSDNERKNSLNEVKALNKFLSRMIDQF